MRLSPHFVVTGHISLSLFSPEFTSLSLPVSILKPSDFMNLHISIHILSVLSINFPNAYFTTNFMLTPCVRMTAIAAACEGLLWTVDMYSRIHSNMNRMGFPIHRTFSCGYCSVCALSPKPQLFRLRLLFRIFALTYIDDYAIA